METLLERDRLYLWHPYTQHGLGDRPLAIRRAYGSHLELEGGTQIIDGISSWWVNLLGHCHPRIQEAISQQALQLEHVLFAGCTHQPAVDLAEALILGARQSGGNFSKVFYSDNGSTAVEVAMKMAFQYHRNGDHPLKENSRDWFLALNHSYHGDTFGAMAVGEPSGFHPAFRSLLTHVDFFDAEDLASLKRLLKENGHRYAAWIVEPLVQGAGGMRFHSPEFLFQATKLCQTHGLLVIFDEVFTGFYRTGTRFAFEKAKISPDFLCLSKGITGGFLPLAATLTTEKIFQKFSSTDLSQAFLHGHSYTANPIACAAALATWKELETASTQEKISEISQLTRQFTEALRNHPMVSETRSLGTIGVVQVEGESNYFSNLAPRIRKKAIEKGVLLRPLGNVLYTVPPYCIKSGELARIYEVIREILDEIYFDSQRSDKSSKDIKKWNTLFNITDV